MASALTSLCLALALTTAEEDTAVVSSRKLQEVVVVSSAATQRMDNVQIGAEQLQLKELTLSPQLFGEQDIMRSIQLLAGVKAESDASSSFQVRGGTSAQNAILYDQAPVFNVGHLGGLFSTFNDDALGGATLYKGLIPAQYGEATAAVLDINSRHAHPDGWHGSASIGLLSAKASAETPFADGRGSLLVAARRSYMDVLIRRIDDFRNNTLYFYDMNLRADYRLTDRDQLMLSLFRGRDRTAVEELVDLGWSNTSASLSWLHHIASQATSQTTLLHSAYGTDNGFSLLDMQVSFTGHIRQTGLHQMLRLQTDSHDLCAGLQSLLLSVKSAEWQEADNHQKEQRRGWETALWLNDVWTVTPRLDISAGLRLTLFSALGGAPYYDLDQQGDIIRLFRPKGSKLFKTYTTLEPRLSMNYRLSPQLRLKAGFTRSSQNIHALRNQSTATPFDRYTMSSNLVRPQQASQLSAGLFAATRQGDYDLTLEGYYRQADHVLDYRDGKSFSSEIEIERLVLPGHGRSYGAELCLRKNKGRLTGWAAYTLAWAETRISGINGGRWYTAGNDRRHDVDLVGLYRLSSQWTLSMAWVYNSGQAFTAPSGKYAIEDNYIYYYTERNGYRAPAYHRLDASLTWTRPLKRLTREWTFGLYNVYNRYNPFIINFEDSDNGARTRAVQYSLFGIVPSVALTIRF